LQVEIIKFLSSINANLCKLKRQKKLTGTLQINESKSASGIFVTKTLYVNIAQILPFATHKKTKNLKLNRQVVTHKSYLL
jgi:hypothetical protein